MLIFFFLAEAPGRIRYDNELRARTEALRERRCRWSSFTLQRILQAYAIPELAPVIQEDLQPVEVVQALPARSRARSQRGNILHG